MTVKRLDFSAPGFDRELESLLQWEADGGSEIEAQVAELLRAVVVSGDAALLDLTAKFDRWQPREVCDLRVSDDEIEAACRRVPSAQMDALRRAAERIRRYHEHQKQQSWSYQEADGTVLGQRVTALASAGIYVPGGKASYPSSVLMNALPAQVAGVARICMVVPSPDGDLNPLVLAAAQIAGIHEIWRIGGAQAIAALAFGTESIAKVDKIVGPGNAYVATAKRQVFGRVGLDMIAGPSEVMVVSDGSAPVNWLALDLFAQAEHDEMAQSLLISPDEAHLNAVHAEIETLLPGMERADIIRQSLAARGALIKVDNLDQAMELANRIAPEHLELAVKNPESLVEQVAHAGAIFLGAHSPEAFGDYCAGPNHVLPTSATARFASPLGVYDFQKRTSLIHCSAIAAAELGDIAASIADGEGLQAHALSALARRP